MSKPLTIQYTGKYANHLLREKDKEIEKLNKEIIGLNNCIIEFHSEFCNKQAEINRLNNIINELEKDIDLELYKTRANNEYNKGLFNAFRYVKNKLQELKGSDKE